MSNGTEKKFNDHIEEYIRDCGVYTSEHSIPCPYCGEKISMLRIRTEERTIEDCPQCGEFFGLVLTPAVKWKTFGFNKEKGQ